MGIGGLCRGGLVVTLCEEVRDSFLHGIVAFGDFFFFKRQVS